MKTKFTFKNGAVRSINHKAAEILQKAGKGTYQTRDMVADRFDPATYEPSIPVNLAELEAAAELADDLDSMDRDALYDLAKERGVEVHHRAGADKIRAALRGEVSTESE